MNVEAIRASEMALSDVIDKLPDDEVIHIGSDTGFFFVGSKAEYYRDIDQISKDYLQTVHKKLKEHLKRIKKLNEDLGKPVVDFAQIKTTQGKIRTAVGKAQYNEKYISEFEPIPDRKVLEIYKRLQGDGICVIVTGAEMGNIGRWKNIETNNRKVGRLWELRGIHI